jgi:hypothetical protein
MVGNAMSYYQYRTSHLFDCLSSGPKSLNALAAYVYNITPHSSERFIESARHNAKNLIRHARHRGSVILYDFDLKKYRLLKQGGTPMTN